MKFKSGLVTQVSGSFGGMTGSHNRGGLYFRARAIPVNTNTSFQQTVRNFMSQLTSRWVNTLTEAQRAAWSVYAEQTPMTDSLGDARSIPPLAMYCRCNIARLQAGLAVVDEGPTVYGLPTFTPPTFAVDASDDDVDVAFTDTDEWAIADGGGLVVLASRPQNPTINYFAGPYRFAASIDGAVVPPTSPATILLPFPVALGQKVFFQVRATLADGRISSPFRGSVIAAA
jgi:hypothetical protein